MIVQEIKDRLEKHANPEERRKRINWEKQHQEMPRLYGVPTPVVRKLSSEFFQKIKKKPKQGILQLCNELLKSGYSEERTIAFDWAFRLFETWLTEHMYGWGTCDDLARA